MRVKITLNGVVHTRVERGASVCYYVDEQLHREDGGPAVLYNDRTFVWFRKGIRHRIDGPAVEYADGTEEWWQNGRLHREEGPAVKYPNGQEMWYKHGQRHNENGPAVIYPDGSYWYYINDILINPKIYKEKYYKGGK